MDETLAGPQLERVRALAQTILGEAGETLRPESRSRGSTTKRRAAEVLGELEGLGPGQGRIELAETLGQGGMGLVRLGRQTSMARPVAVKTTRADKRNERTTLKLLREAWVNGALEHPNILPIYDLGIDEGGAPVIVMRLVDGSDWQELMHDAAAVRERFGDEDVLEWNLRVLMQVCNAVHYAHDRNIVHRDLKPANVMLGPFGEVYLVDWGIAVSLAGDSDGRFPEPEPEGEVVGTPAYMAPEMLSGEMQGLGPRTDVYLLGAILVEIISGRAPHRHESIGDFVDSVMRSQPELPSETPVELVHICERAMARDPSERHHSADELRRELQAFLRHRSSMRLVDEGQVQLARLEDHFDVQTTGSDQDGAGAEPIFSAARFAFEAALREWPENPRAHAGLRAAFLRMIDAHLDHADHRAAARLVAELDDAPDSVRERLDALRRQLEADERERERLEALGRDHDARFGQRTRWFVLLVLGSIWSVLPPALAMWAPIPAGFAEVAVFPTVFLLGLGGFAIWGRESLAATAFNRRVTGVLAATLAAQLILTGGGALAGWSMVALLPAEFFLWMVVTTLFCITIDHRFWPVAVGYLLGFLWTSHLQAAIPDPEAFARSALLVMGAAHLVLTLTTLVIWRPRTYFKRLPDEHLRGSG